MKNKSVGKSSRTPFKHWGLSAELGRLMGVFAVPSARDHFDEEAKARQVASGGDRKSDNKKIGCDNVTTTDQGADKARNKAGKAVGVPYYIKPNTGIEAPGMKLPEHMPRGRQS